MINRVIITPYKIGSKTAKAIKNSLKELMPTKKILLVKQNSPTFKSKNKDLNIYWGKTTLHPKGQHLVNQTIDLCTNKIKFFDFITNQHNQNTVQENQVKLPEWTTDYNTALEWYNQGITVVSRATVTSYGGKGINIHELNSDTYNHPPPEAPLYTKYKKKKSEFRVHVVFNSIIDITQKKKQQNFEGVLNTKIRNHLNGWVYCREDITVPQEVINQALNAANAVALTFGAIDIIYNEKENQAYVLEINTAPGLEGTTLEKYTNIFHNKILNHD